MRLRPIWLLWVITSVAMIVGCASTTNVTTPHQTAEPVDAEQHAKLLSVLSSERERIVQVALRQVLETATPQEIVGLGCLAGSRVASVESRREVSESARSVIAEILGRLPRSEISCPPISDQWTLDFLTYSRWKTVRGRDKPSEAPSEAERAFSDFMSSRSIAAAFPQGAVMGATLAIVSYAAAAYAASCIGTVGLVCPIPGETIFVALATSTAAQNGRPIDLIGIGVAQGSGQISAWAALLEDPEALSLALAQALKAAASNYMAAVMTDAITSPPNGSRRKP